MEPFLLPNQDDNWYYMLGLPFCITVNRFSTNALNLNDSLNNALMDLHKCQWILNFKAKFSINVFYLHDSFYDALMDLVNSLENLVSQLAQWLRILLNLRPKCTSKCTKIRTWKYLKRAYYKYIENTITNGWR